MIIIGITGSIGMGKTTIANMLKYIKIPIHDSDLVVKHLIENNVVIINKIQEIWPRCIIYKGRKSEIDKNELAEIIFNNEKERIKLEKIIHPFVIKSRNDFIRVNKNNKKTIIGIDVPLLYETNSDKICDYIFLASATKKKQETRVLKRNNMSIEKFNKINNNQLSNEEKKKKKPIIISTNFGKLITFALITLNLLLLIIKGKKIKK